MPSRFRDRKFVAAPLYWGAFFNHGDRAPWLQLFWQSQHCFRAGTIFAIRWREEAGDCVEVIVRDEGEGIMNPTNLFVPFFTTKPGGSGIGLTLSRQIAEAHGGTLSLANRTDRTGAEAVLRLPR